MYIYRFVVSRFLQSFKFLPQLNSIINNNNNRLYTTGIVLKIGILKSLLYNVLRHCERAEHVPCITILRPPFVGVGVCGIITIGILGFFIFTGGNIFFPILRSKFV